MHLYNSDLFIIGLLMLVCAIFGWLGSMQSRGSKSKFLGPLSFVFIGFMFLSSAFEPNDQTSQRTAVLRILAICFLAASIISQVASHEHKKSIDYRFKK